MAIKSQPFMNAEEAASLRKLDISAINKVQEEAWPTVRTADELHDALMVMGFILESEQGKSFANLDILIDSGWQHLFDELAEDNRAYKIKLKGNDLLWIASERLHEFKTLFPDLELLYNTKKTPPHFLAVSPADNPLLEIIRSRLEILGPISASQLSHALGIETSEVNHVLLLLEQEGFIIQGHFTQQNQELEWCERRLLARIHHYTISRLRREIEPVSLSQYMHFLFEWQGLLDKSKGTESLAHVLEQLEGISASADAWQKHILPARIENLSVDMLDNLCISGRINWLRLNVVDSQDKRKKSPVSHTPIALVQRSHLAQWQKFSSSPEKYNLGPYAQKVVDVLKQKGALFFFDIVKETGVLRTQVEDALGECVNWGLVTSDAYVGLRALITPSAKRPKYSSRQGRGAAKMSPFDNAGRWSLINQDAVKKTLLDESQEKQQKQVKLQQPNAEDLEFIAWTLLHRYGVIFRKMLEREQNLPPWRDLLRVYWRMEARGEIRGGRFVNGVSGEQFGLSEALSVLKKSSKREKSNQQVSISSADPLNLVGILLPGDKIPISPHSMIHFVDGVVVKDNPPNKSNTKHRSFTSLPIAVGKQ